MMIRAGRLVSATEMPLGDQTITATASGLIDTATVIVAPTGAPGADVPGVIGNQATALDAPSTAPVESDQ